MEWMGCKIFSSCPLMSLPPFLERIFLSLSFTPSILPILSLSKEDEIKENKKQIQKLD